MRFGVMIAAAAAMLCAGQASAEVFYVGVNGFVTGTQITYGCNGQTYCTSTSPFSALVSSRFGYPLDLAQGANSFSIGDSDGYFTGTIVNTDRVLTGTNLVYSTFSCMRGSPPRTGCSDVQSATAATFNVVGGIPEPTTWAMMILGMGAVGFAMRRRNTTTRVGFA